MGVVPAGGGQHMAVVGQRDEVERQVRQGDLLTGRTQDPAIRQEEAPFGGAGEPGRSWAREIAGMTQIQTRTVDMPDNIRLGRVLMR